ncbi:GAF and ANTAR domain-containing protein [Nocardioides aestuarii]|uniref:GAF and ANTAR domain-containing protein n=1 Tax=Nocardioides aestuarii TaxID=252231 RepID=A0ABW4TNE7_9ACTN
MTEDGDTLARERDIIQAFLDLSNELVDDYDVVEMLSRLTTNCAEILDIGSAGLLLADDRGLLHLVASSSERTQLLELFQLQREQGPCLDCFRDGRTVVAPDLATLEERWPQFAEAARTVGFASVHALPMRLRNSVLGTLGLFGEADGRLDDEDLALAQALVHVASVALVNQKAAADRTMVNEQLQHALTSRIVVEQAKGVVAHTGGMDMDVAFDVLRHYARAHGRKLTEVASEVVRRTLSGEELLRHAREPERP